MFGYLKKKGVIGVSVVQSQIITTHITYKVNKFTI